MIGSLVIVFISLQCQKTLQRFWKATRSRVSESLLSLIGGSNQNLLGTRSRTSTGSVLCIDVIRAFCDLNKKIKGSGSVWNKKIF